MTTYPSVRPENLGHPVIVFCIIYRLWISESLCHLQRAEKITFLQLESHLRKVKKEEDRKLCRDAPYFYRIPH